VEFSGEDAAILARDPETLDAAGQANYRNVRRFHGAPLQMSAPHLANLWVRHDLAAGQTGAYLAAGVNMVRDQTLLPDSAPSERQSYTLLGALAGWTWQRQGGQRISLEVAGRNLTGERYRPSQSTRARPRELLIALKAAM
jgi:iron complex outermembrane receptor protein